MPAFAYTCVGLLIAGLLARPLNEVPSPKVHRRESVGDAVTVALAKCIFKKLN